MPETAQPSEAPPVSRGQNTQLVFPAPRQLFSCLAVYFALQVVIRTFLSDSADLDETDQLLLTQKLSWGYGPQPPLYTWLQIGFFSVFGQTIFALSLFKNLLLLCTYGLTYWNARLVTRSQACGVAAAMSLLLLPQVAWESQRDLTHSVLASTFAAATLLCLLRVQANGRTSDYAWFGLCAGLGLISKYNYPFWLLGLSLAACTVPEFRPATCDRRMLLALGLCLLVFLPNGWWIVSHPHLAFLTASKFELPEKGPWLRAVLNGLRRMASVVAAFVGPLGVVYLLVFWRPRKRAQPEALLPGARLILRAFLLVLAVLVLLVLGFRAQGFKDRWFQPILVSAPVLASALVGRRMDARRLKWLALAAGVVMVVVALAMPGRILLAERMKREEPLNRPYRELALQLRPAIPASALIVTDTRVLGGNLRLAFPQQQIIVPELAGLFSPPRRPCVLVWDATEQPTPPTPLTRWAQTALAAELSQATPEYFSATYKFHRARQLRLGLLRIE